MKILNDIAMNQAVVDSGFGSQFLEAAYRVGQCGEEKRSLPRPGLPVMLYGEGVGCIACKLFDPLFEVCQRTESGFVIRRYGGERFSQLPSSDHVDEQAVVQPACVH
ncbi:hypothetical protein D3C87_1544380 [compost metagenome]